MGGTDPRAAGNDLSELCRCRLRPLDAIAGAVLPLAVLSQSRGV